MIKPTQSLPSNKRKTNRRKMEKEKSQKKKKKNIYLNSLNSVLCLNYQDRLNTLPGVITHHLERVKVWTATRVLRCHHLQANRTRNLAGGSLMEVPLGRMIQSAQTVTD